MGYYVSIELEGVLIPAKNVEQCLQAINKLHSDANLKARAGGGCDKPGTVRETHWYSWVTNPPEGEGFKTLAEAFDAWRYDSTAYSNGDVLLDSFHSQKWGDDEILYKAIAPFVTHGGTISCDGEDGEKWVYSFKDGKVRVSQARLVYDDEQDV